jgi:glucose-6-phosphate isomerase
MYKKCAPDVDIKNNPALQLAAALYLLEKKAYDQIFTSIYSSRLVKFLSLMVQLIHESSCKDGKGQTIYGDMGPETQHHSNQRFFGGKKNAVGLFVTVCDDDQKTKIKIPEKLKDIKLKDSTLRELDNLNLCKALEFEFLGTRDDAVNNKIPIIHIHLDKITPESIGEYLALWQYIAVYSSWLRDVNPFDQPHVEESKRISFEYLKRHKQ